MLILAALFATAPSPCRPGSSAGQRRAAQGPPWSLSGHRRRSSGRRARRGDWERAGVATGFIQNEPREGEPASEDTEVRVLYDDANLYIGVFAHDRDPGAIAVTDLRKDFAGASPTRAPTPICSSWCSIPSATKKPKTGNGPPPF